MEAFERGRARYRNALRRLAKDAPRALRPDPQFGPCTRINRGTWRKEGIRDAGLLLHWLALETNGLRRVLFLFALAAAYGIAIVKIIRLSTATNGWP
jgi:hypothetical protein